MSKVSIKGLEGDLKQVEAALEEGVGDKARLEEQRARLHATLRKLTASTQQGA